MNEKREQLVGLEPLLGLLGHHGPSLFADDLDRVERRVERPGDALGLRERLPDERERGRQRDAVLEAETLQVGEALARADPRERPPVVTRQLAPKIVHEPGLVGVARRERERDDQVGDVVGAVLRDREQEQRE